MRPPSRHSLLMNGDSQNPPSSRDGRYDIESRGGKSSLKSRFRDAVASVIEDGRRTKMKKLLLEGMDRYNFERYRKTPEEVGER